MSRVETTILFAMELPAELIQYFDAELARLNSAQSGSVRALYAGGNEDAQVLPLAGEANVIIGWRCTEELLVAADNLKLWIFPGVGVQRLIKPFRKLNGQRSVVLCNCHGNTYATAQHAVALLLALMNKVIPHHNWMADGQWRKNDKDAMSATLTDCTIGLLGYGKVNKKVHRFLGGFNVQFNILKRTPGLEGKPANVAGVYTVDGLHEFLRASDVLMVAAPETDETVGMIGAGELGLLGSSGLLVNVARGSLIDEAVLYSALDDGGIAGAALDVWYSYNPEPDADGRKYPYSSEHPFHQLDNVVMSPHRAASPVFALKRWEEVVQIIELFHSGGSLINIVDLETGY